MNGMLEVLWIAVSLAIVMAGIQRVLQRPTEMRALKQKQADIKRQLDEAKRSSDKRAIDQAMTELLKVSQQQLKLSMKPMLLTTLIFFTAFVWLSRAYADLQIAIPFTLPFIGSQFGWFWWYLIIVIPATQIFRKVFGVE